MQPILLIRKCLQLLSSIWLQDLDGGRVKYSIWLQTATSTQSHAHWPPPKYYFPHQVSIWCLKLLSGRVCLHLYAPNALQIPYPTALQFIPHQFLGTISMRQGQSKKLPVLWSCQCVYFKNSENSVFISTGCRQLFAKMGNPGL